jgi:hypothetical protein
MMALLGFAAGPDLIQATAPWVKALTPGIEQCPSGFAPGEGDLLVHAMNKIKFTA